MHWVVIPRRILLQHTVIDIFEWLDRRQGDRGLERAVTVIGALNVCVAVGCEHIFDIDLVRELPDPCPAGSPDSPLDAAILLARLPNCRPKPI